MEVLPREKLEEIYLHYDLPHKWSFYEGYVRNKLVTKTHQIKNSRQRN